MLDERLFLLAIIPLFSWGFPHTLAPAASVRRYLKSHAYAVCPLLEKDLVHSHLQYCENASSSTKGVIRNSCLLLWSR